MMKEAFSVVLLAGGQSRRMGRDKAMLPWYRETLLSSLLKKYRSLSEDVIVAGHLGRPLPPGETGEVVVTPLGVEGMPLVRFRTGDVGYLAAAPCACGRRTPRLSPILGRRAQMLKIRGTTFYPATAFEVLNDVPEIGEYYLEVETRGGEDQACAHLSLHPDRPETRRKIEDRLLARLRVRIQLSVEPEDDVRRQVYAAHSRKPIRFIDRRGNSPAKA